MEYILSLVGVGVVLFFMYHGDILIGAWQSQREEDAAHRAKAKRR